MTPSIWKAAGVLALALAAAGCSSGGGGGTPPTEPPAKFESQFGPASGFPAAFGQSPHSEPRDVSQGDVIPINPTAEPVTLPGT